MTKNILLNKYVLVLALYSTFSISYATLPPITPCDSCTHFPLQTKWNYVLSESPNLAIKVDVYDIDGFDNNANVINNIHSQGSKAICYISAGTWENWRIDASQFPASVKGRTNGWPGEKWLDIRKIEILGPIMINRISMCKSKGFDAVEFDNVDGYTNKTGFPLTATDQLNYNIFLANSAHSMGLLAGLKNDIDQVHPLLPYFDFAINEQCFQYNECNALTAFITANKPVLHVEYKLDTSKFCSNANGMNFNSIKKGINLTNPVTFCR